MKELGESVPEHTTNTGSGNNTGESVTYAPPPSLVSTLHVQCN